MNEFFRIGLHCLLQLIIFLILISTLKLCLNLNLSTRFSSIILYALGSPSSFYNLVPILTFIYGLENAKNSLTASIDTQQHKYECHIVFILL
jgi:hypothetical protein